MNGPQGRETIAAIATAPGRGAIAIVRMSGPAASAIALAACRPGRVLRPRVAELRTIVSPDGAAIDEGLAIFFPGPRSYTGEDVVELHVHGSPAVARETLLAVLAGGARLASAGEFTRRAFEAGKLDLSAAEAVADLIAAEHRGAVRGAAARLAGGLAAEVERHAAALGAICEELAAALDFPDEVDAPAAPALAARIAAIDGALAQLSEDWERGRLVREGVSVAIVGPPNAGKSSLLNGLLGVERALVSPRAGTTRDTIDETAALGGGVVARLTDTAGIRRSDDDLEAAGVARSEAALAAATIALVVVDGSQPLGPEAEGVLRRTRERPRLVYFNKLDLGSAGFEARAPQERDALAGSALEALDVARVRDSLARLAAGGEADLARPHLGTARQADAVLEARRALEFALETLARGESVDLVAGDLFAAQAALRELTGRDASEAVLDGVFGRFCVGK
jgi:tRNA modification GTPase